VPAAEEIARVLAGSCLRCHGPELEKGRLRLDRAEGLERVVVPGDLEESELWFRASLPEGDPDLMPPEGPRLPERDLALLRRWIEQGPGLEAVAGAVAASDRAREEARAGLVRLRDRGAVVVALEGDPAGPLRVDFGRREDPVRAGDLEALAPLAPRILELSLAGHDLRGGLLERLPELPALEILRLDRARFEDDEAGRCLARLPGLRVLGLYGSAAGPRTLEAAAGLSRLEQLFLAETALDPAAIEAFRRRRPEVRVPGEARLPARPFPGSAPRRILAADASKKRIALLQETALQHFDLLWEHPVEALHDLQGLENGHVLFQVDGTRILEVDPFSGETVWSYDASVCNRRPGDGPVEVHSFRRLEDGTTLIAESGPARLLFVDPAGEAVHVIPLYMERPDSHRDIRLVRPTPEGTFLVAHEGDGAVREYDREGRIVWEYRVPLFGREPAPGHGFEAWGNRVFAALRLPGGTTLITTGNGHGLLEVDREGRILWRIGQEDLPGLRLAWTTTVQVLSNGHLVLGNCHGGPEQPQLIEFTRDRRVVWTFRDHERFGDALSNAYVFEDPFAHDF